VKKIKCCEYGLGELEVSGDNSIPKTIEAVVLSPRSETGPAILNNCKK
jgi:hypothetical protein